MTFPQFLFLSVLTLWLTYFVTGIVIFVLNGYHDIGFIMENSTSSFTYTALVEGYPKSFEALGGTFLTMLLLNFSLSFLLKEKKALYGSARFANLSEIKNKIKLLGDKGLIIGKYKNKYLRFDSQEFVSVGAPTRSGKGVSIVIPNLLEWRDSAVVLDIKQECFDITSKYRKEKLKQDIFLFNPFDFRTHRYNPLTYIDMEDPGTRDNDLLDFVNLLYPLSGDSTTQFFNSQAQNLFIGLCYLFKDLTTSIPGKEFLDENELNFNFTMYDILKLSHGFNIEDPNATEEEDNSVNGLDESLEYLAYLEITSNETKEKLANYINIESQNTKSGVLSSFNGPLLIFQNEPIRSATCESDFDLRELRKKKMTLYIGILPDKLAIATPILNIFFSQLFSLNTKDLPSRNKNLKYSTLLLMDEFTSIGEMPILLKSVAYIAGYNLRLLTIFQSESQLETAPPNGYGKDGARTLMANHAVKIYFAPDDEIIAERLAKRLGDVTVKSTSRGHSTTGLFSGSSSKNESDQKRFLMLPQELIELGFENQLITKANSKPIFAQKVLYYEDPYFINKLKSVSSTLDAVKKKPSKEDFEAAMTNNELNVSIPIQRRRV